MDSNTYIRVTKVVEALKKKPDLTDEEVLRVLGLTGTLNAARYYRKLAERVIQKQKGSEGC